MSKLGGAAAALANGACACALTAAMAAPAALADGTAPGYPASVLHVSIPGQKVEGKVVTIVATGTNQMTSLGTPIDYGLYLFLVDPTRLPGPCATSESTELNNVANNPGAARQLNYQQYNEGEDGPFTIKVPFTPEGTGRLLVCAYSEYVTDDAAWASTQASITKPAAARPANTARPRITRSGRKLSCSRGTWSGRPTSYAYRWKVGRTPSHVTRSTLTLAPGARGRVVCTVTATNAGGKASASSRAVSVG